MSMGSYLLLNYTSLLSQKMEKRKKKKHFQCVQGLPTNPHDISSAGMGIWVRLSSSVFGGVSPS